MKKRSSPVPSIVGCLVIQLCVGIIYLWSAFNGKVVASFAWTKTAATMVSSYMLFAFVIGNFIGGFINDRKSPKFAAIIGVIMFAAGVGASGLLTPGSIGLIYLTYSVIAGLGSGIAYGACIQCLQKWLPHRRGLASGLAVSAFGFSTVVFGPVSEALMNAFQTDGLVNFGAVFPILAGVFFVLGIAACTFVRLPNAAYLAQLPKVSANTRVVSTKKNYTLSEAVKTVPFWVMFLYLIFINATWTLCFPVIRNLADPSEGGRLATAAAATFAVSFTGIPNAAGRLIMATVSDKFGRIPASLFLCALTAVAAILMTFIAGIPFIIVVGLIAFGYGGPSAINAAITTDFFGPKNAGTNYGVIMMGLGVSSVLFNWISGAFLKSAPTPTFIMAAVTAALAAGCMLVINVHLKKMKAEG
ncbi:MAG: MFS transporter [Oscillospiraceae bacterium]|jgi:OFA family oxalate/formate antiporter-like MFS transporter|nr:MFS transporter [Oscillospiraceae bacterium]